MSAEVELCALDDIEDGGSGGFVAETPDGKRAVMVIRRGERVHVYVNSCPHIGAPLDFEPGRFLNLDKSHIMCSTHGALFNIDDGHCISGPCAGENLEPVTSAVENGKIILRF